MNDFFFLNATIKQKRIKEVFLIFLLACDFQTMTYSLNILRYRKY